MAVKIRLQRHGKKGKPFFWVVAADARSKRDGKFLEKIGTYNPTLDPAVIDLDVDAAVKWLQNGAQPTETAKRLLSYKGALLKNHLAGGVRKGALTEEQMEEKYNAWLEEKSAKIDSKKQGLSEAEAKKRKEALAAEKEVNEARAKANQPEPETSEENTAEAASEEPQAEAATENETPSEEKKEEASK